ncbi:MAG: hypothetical protein ABR969_01550 [Sedimentisphaerales bacterium]|jgi:uncharacterized protein YhhL (DUF1145 family)
MTAERGLKWLLRFIGIMTIIPTFIAAVMPQEWLAYLVNKAEPGTSAGILINYLARVLMAMYFLVGMQCFVFASDIKRYRPLIWLMSVVILIVAMAGLVVLFSTVQPDHRTGFFWVAFGDLAEGFAQTVLVVILLLRIPHCEP